MRHYSMFGRLQTFLLVYHITVSLVIMTDLRPTDENENFYVTRNTGFRYVYDILKQLQVFDLVECALQCTNFGCCTVFNYRQRLSANLSSKCEITGRTEDLDSKYFERNSEYSFYEAFENKCLNGGKCEVNSSSYFGYSCVCRCQFYGQRCERKKVFKSCKELSNCESEDDEYYLQLQFPTCNKSIRVFCADMNTNDPKEYITLTSGEENNFSHLDNTMSPQDYNHYGSTTKFSKIRVEPDLHVNTADHRFARITWNDTMVRFQKYGLAGDCISRVCSSSKNGTFKMDIRESGLQFVTPIKWRYFGWPPECAGQQPLNYKVDEKKQVALGNCGSRCGGCEAEELFLKIEGC